MNEGYESPIHPQLITKCQPFAGCWLRIMDWSISDRDSHVHCPLRTQDSSGHLLRNYLGTFYLNIASPVPFVVKASNYSGGSQEVVEFFLFHHFFIKQMHSCAETVTEFLHKLHISTASRETFDNATSSTLSNWSPLLSWEPNSHGPSGCGNLELDPDLCSGDRLWLIWEKP